MVEKKLLHHVKLHGPTVEIFSSEKNILRWYSIVNSQIKYISHARSEIDGYMRTKYLPQVMVLGIYGPRVKEYFPSFVKVCEKVNIKIWKRILRYRVLTISHTCLRILCVKPELYSSPYCKENSETLQRQYFNFFAWPLLQSARPKSETSGLCKFGEH